MKQVKKLVGAIVLVLALFPPAGSAQEPNAAAILDGVRLAKVDRELNGQLRKEDGTTIPFRLILSGSQVVYRFGNPDETLRVELKDSASTLRQDEGGKSRLVAGSQLTEKVRGGRRTDRQGFFMLGHLGSTRRPRQQLRIGSDVGNEGGKRSASG